MQSIAKIEKDIANLSNTTHQTKIGEINLSVAKPSGGDNSQPIALEYCDMIVDNSLHEYNDIAIDESLIESAAIEIVQGTKNDTSNTQYVRSAIENTLYNNTSSHSSEPLGLVQVVDTMYEEIYPTGDEAHARGVSIPKDSETNSQQDFERLTSPVALAIRNQTWWKIDK